MAYTILLIPVALFGLLVLGAAVAIRWIAWETILGQLAFRVFKIQLETVWAAFTGTILFSLVEAGPSSIPTLGSLLNPLLALISYGAVFLTRFGLQSFHPQAIVGSLSCSRFKLSTKTRS